MPLKTATMIAIVGTSIGVLFSVSNAFTLLVNSTSSFGLALRILVGGTLPQCCMLLFLAVLYRNQR